MWRCLSAGGTVCSLLTLVNRKEAGVLAKSAAWKTAQRSPLVRKPQGLRIRSGVVSGSRSRMAMQRK